MKKIITLLVLTLTLSSFTLLNAQLTFDFENWTTSGDYEIPNPTDFWGDPNATVKTLVGVEGLVAQCESSSEKHGDYSAAMLTAKKYSLAGGAYEPVLQGFLHTGTVTLDDETHAVIADIRVAKTEKWKNFTGWFKYAPATGDSCIFYAELYAADSVVVAQAIQKFAAAADYTQFTIPFVYSDNSAAVTHMGVFISASNTTPLTGPYGGADGSVLYIDDLEFNTGTTSINYSLLSKTDIKVYAVNDGSILNIDNAQNATIEIYSISGKVLMTETIQSDKEYLSIEQLHEGLYLYRITTNDAQITSGKFIK